MVFSTKTKKRVLKKYLNQFRKEYEMNITNYKELQRITTNILLLNEILRQKAQKCSKYTVKPVAIPTSDFEPTIAVKKPDIDKLDLSGIKVTFLEQEEQYNEV